MKICIRFGALFAAALLFATSASAASFQLITLRGNVTSLNGPWDNSVAIGTPFVATVRVDLAARDRDPAPTLGVFVSESSPMTVSVGGYNFAAASSTVEIENGPLGDAYEFESEDGINAAGFTELHLNASLESTNPSLLANDALPIQDLPISAFNDKHEFRIRTNEGELRANIVSFVVDGLTQTAPAVTKRLVNVSTRAKVELGDDRVIAGFVITGTDPKRVLIRALGPSLTAFGVRNALANPSIQIYGGTPAQLIAQNDNWQDTQAVEIAATPFAPTNALESAALLTLPAGPYTVVVSGVNNTVGVTLVEVYEL